MEKSFYIIAFLITFTGFGQVGIGNTSPNATLDISASDIANPSSTDGILIPRMDDFPTTDPGSDQDGMLIFITGAATTSRGFYYWSSAIGVWEHLLESEIDGDNSNELQNLSISGDELQISSGNSVSMLPYINPKFPDGMANIDPVIYRFSGDYQVPVDKNLYITNYYSSSVARLEINGLLVRYGQNNYSNNQTITSPIIAGPGDLISSTNSAAIMNGFLVDAFVEPVVASGYTVPANKILVILGGNNTLAGSPATNYIRVAGYTVYYGGGNTPSSNTYTAFHNPIFVDEGQSVTTFRFNFYGYLMDK